MFIGQKSASVPRGHPEKLLINVPTMTFEYDDIQKRIYLFLHARRFMNISSSY
jgi:hypothetical protein